MVDDMLIYLIEKDSIESWLMCEQLIPSTQLSTIAHAANQDYLDPLPPSFACTSSSQGANMNSDL